MLRARRSPSGAARTSRASSLSRARRDDAHGLTPRELQVLRLVAANKAIAAESLCRASAPSTARDVSNIFAKLRLSLRAGGHGLRVRARPRRAKSPMRAARVGSSSTRRARGRTRYRRPHDRPTRNARTHGGASSPGSPSPSDGSYLAGISTAVLEGIDDGPPIVLLHGPADTRASAPR